MCEHIVIPEPPGTGQIRVAPEEIEKIASAIAECPPRGQIAALVSLKHLRHPAIRLAAWKALDQRDADVQAAAMAALIRSGTADDVPALVALMKSDGDAAFDYDGNLDPGLTIRDGGALVTEGDPEKRQYWDITLAERLGSLGEHPLLGQARSIGLMGGVEIDGVIADDINVSVIQEQVEMGVAIRMAVLASVARAPKSGDGALKNTPRY